MRDQNGFGIMFLILLMRHSRELAIAAVLGMAALLVWGLVWLLSGR